MCAFQFTAQGRVFGAVLFVELAQQITPRPLHFC